jgi:hypothetical protein
LNVDRETRVKNHRASLLCYCVVVLGVLLRSIYLDADPYYYEWAGYITDEGRWVQHARSWALHGTLVGPYLTNIHFVFAPLFQLSNYLVFKMLGVSLLTARIFTAMCGSALLVCFWAMLRHRVSPQALLIGITLLAVQADLVMLSRVAVPEMVILFFQLLIYFVIVSNGQSSWRMVLAGVLLFAGLAMKTTILALLPIFSVMILAMPRKPTKTRRWHDLTLFWIGVAAPVLLAGGFSYYFLLREPVYSQVVRDNLLTTKLFLGWTSLYNAVSFPFMAPLSGTINIWLLGVWLTVLAWCSVSPAEIDFRSHRYLATSGTWIIGYSLLALSLGYFPSRYKVHVLLPIALFTTVGVHVIERIGMPKIIDSIAAAKRSYRFLRLAFVSAPTAAFVSPLLVSAVVLFGIDGERLATKLACAFLSLIAATYVAHRLKHNRQVIGFFLTFPLVEGIVWMALSTLAGGYAFWPTAELPSHAAVLSLTILTAMVLSVFTVKACFASKLREGSRAITAVAVICLIIMVTRIAPGYVNPHFSMRKTSQDLERLLVNSFTIAAVRSDSLFIQNKLRYKSSLDLGWPPERTEIVVSAFISDSDPWKNILDHEYHVMQRYKLFTAPDYYRSLPDASQGLLPQGVTAEGVAVTVYKRNDEIKLDYQ